MPSAPSFTPTPRFPVFLHGGDYNPDQWLDHPEILEQDIELMHKAHVNCVSIAIFAWARLEPEDGVYDFAWLDEVIDRLWRGGIHVILATPSGARPAWMAQKYPEVLRVNQHYERYHFGGRHNHCLTSPVYRRKVREMDTALAQRYAHHPAVILGRWKTSIRRGGHRSGATAILTGRRWKRLATWRKPAPTACSSTGGASPPISARRS